MAITRAQQVRQMLEDGGMLVKPRADGKRPGYYGPDAGEGGKESDFGKDAYSGGISAIDRGEGPGGTDQQFDRAKQAIDNRAAAEAKEKERIAKEAAAAFNKRQIERKALERRKRMGLKLMKEKIPGTQEYLDAEDDDTAAELDLFLNDPMTRESFLPLTLKPFEQPLKKGAVKTRGFFADPNYKSIFGKDKNTVLEAGNFNYKGAPLTQERFDKMTLTEKNQAFKDYMGQRNANTIDAYGNPLNTGDDRGPTVPLIPRTIANMTDDAADSDAEEKENVGRMFRLLADGGMTEDAPVGGIMDIETGRQMYGLGKLVKKATRAVKKIAKSPIGKAALLYAGGSYLSGMGALKGLPGAGFLKSPKFLNFMFKEGVPGFSTLTGKGAMAGIAALSALPLLKGQEEDDEEDIDRGPPLEIDRIRANPYLFTPRRFAAEGGSMKEPVAKKTMPLIDMDGKEKDYRETGGFVDMGRMERADDVPARLSKNEFVFTADAVRNAGDGSVDKGAEVMYNMMKNLEAGGDVSEESQGLDGARKMFQTSQRLGEVL